ncbi:MAG TPA: hypothetical protein VMK84_28585 [Streptosporangiaceae bacterium]|nr:hypothetical protein [Streptosporangiaceae bacterium]
MADADVKALRAKYVTACALEPWGEAAAVAVLLGFRAIAWQHRFIRHVNKGGVDWPALLDENWSECERFLIATAAGLWTGRPCGADVCKVPFLDDGFYETWLAMVTASRTGKVPENG